MSETSFNVPLPSSVKKQLARADEIRAQQGNTAPPAASPTADPAASSPPPAPPAAPQVSAPPAPPATAAPPAPAPAPAAPAAAQPGEVERLTQALSVLRGKYDSEVPALHAQVRSLNEQLATAQNEVNQLREQAKQVHAQGSAALDFFKNEVSPEYAENLLALVRGQVAPIEQQFQAVNQRTVADTKAAFWKAVGDAHPDWEQVNTRWLAWLATPSPTGEIWDHALQRGMSTLNAQTVNSILSAFKNHEAAGSTANQGPGPIILPGNSGGGGNPAPEKRQYRQSEIQAFYTEKRKLVTGQSCIYSPDQAQALEADIFAAQREGRVLPG